MKALDAHVGRRQILKGFLVAGPTLAIAARLGLTDGAGAFPTRTDELPDAHDVTDSLVLSQQPTIYDLKIEIKPDGRVLAELPKQDIGQGIMTTFGMMVADNLDTTFDMVDVELARADQKWGAAQITGGSHNTRVLWDPVRLIGAKMRGQLLAAASERMGISVAQLRTEDGHVVATNGQKVSYGELTAAAARLIDAKAALPKKASEYKVIGKPQVRHNSREIVQGRQKYSMDLFSSKEYLPTVLAMAATHGASVVSIDDSEAKKIPGVIAVTHIPGMPDYLIPEGVAVTAETFGIAKKAKNALRIKWSAGPMDQLSDAQIDELLNGIIDQVTSPGEGIEGTFRWPYVPHAPMEENAAVADVRCWPSPPPPGGTSTPARSGRSTSSSSASWPRRSARTRSTSGSACSTPPGTRPCWRRWPTKASGTGTTSSLLGQAHDGFALAFRAGLHVDKGATRESNFHDYRWARMFDSAPEMSVHILPNSNVLPGGVGELGVPAAAAAAINAWARATGKQPRNFPLNEYGA